MAQKLGENVRERRKLRQLSLDQLALLSGVSRAALSQMETCRGNPSLSVLWKVSVSLGMSLGELLGGGVREPAAVKCRGPVMRSADGRVETRMLSPAGSRVEVLECRLPSGGIHVPEVRPPGTRELVVVLDGTIRLRLPDEQHEVDAGESVWIHADQVREYENSGTADVRYHDVVVPGR